MGPLFAAPVPANKEPGAVAVLSSKSDLPNAELERTPLPVVAGAHLFVQKIISPAVLPSAATVFCSTVLVNNLQIRETALLVKDYLFHIYPTHHFW